MRTSFEGLKQYVSAMVSVGLAATLPMYWVPSAYWHLPAALAVGSSDHRLPEPTVHAAPAQVLPPLHAKVHSRVAGL